MVGYQSKKKLKAQVADVGNLIKSIQLDEWHKIYLEDLIFGVLPNTSLDDDTHVRVCVGDSGGGVVNVAKQ